MAGGVTPSQAAGPRGRGRGWQSRLVCDVREMSSGLLEAARLQVPDDVAGLLVEKGRVLGADGVTVFLVDHEQYLLVPVPESDLEREPLRIDATLAGRCFRQTELQRSLAEERETVWVPLLDGLERLGVVELVLPTGVERASDDELHSFAALIAEMVLVKSAYGDLFQVVRRRRPMSLAGEIAWRLLPPLTFGTDRLVIAAVLAPAYEVGGDSFDYAVTSTTARFAVFDAMGHGLPAGLLATVASARTATPAVRDSTWCGPPSLSTRRWPPSSGASSSSPLCWPSSTSRADGCAGTPPVIPPRCCCGAAGS